MGTSFDLFWAKYPRRDGKKDALKAWNKLNPDEALFKRIMVSLEAQIQTAQWQKAMREPGMPYVKLPAGWLRSERWNDEAICGPKEPTLARDVLDPEVQRLCDRHNVSRYSALTWLTGAFFDDTGRLVVPDETNYGWCAKHYGPLFGVEVTRR